MSESGRSSVSPDRWSARFFCLTYVDVTHREDFALVVVGLCRQADRQRHRADAAHEHTGHIQQLCAGVQLPRDTHRQAHRTERRAGLEDAVDDRHRLCGVVVHHDGRAERRHRADDDDGQSAVDRLGLDVVAADDAVIAALCHAADGQDEHREGRHLDSAARRTGGRTDELQHAHQQLADGAAGREVDGVHPRSTGGYRLEQRRHDLARDGQAAHRPGVRPLEQGQQRRAAHPEDDRELQHDFRVEGEPPLFAVLCQLHPDHEAQTTGHDHEHDDSLHIVVVDVRHQRGVGAKPSEEIKACVAKSRDGREHADPHTFCAELRHECEEQQHNAHGLESRRQLDDDLQHLSGLGQAVCRDALAQQPQVAEAHPPPGRQREEAGEGDKAEAAHLNEHQDDHLPEQRKLAPCIPHDEARHAGGTGGGEHGVDDPQPPRPAGNGQGKQQRSHRDDQQKAAADGLRRTAARQPALVGSACPLFGFVFSHCNLPGLPRPAARGASRSAAPAQSFPAQEPLFIGYTFFLSDST